MKVGIDANEWQEPQASPGVFLYHHCAKTAHLRGKENSPLRKLDVFFRNLLVPDFPRQTRHSQQDSVVSKK